MSDYSMTAICMRLAITVVFAVGAASAVLLMILIAGLADGQFAPAGAARFWWLGSSAKAGAYGALTGLIVDGLRCLSDFYWPRKLRSRVELEKLMQRHLS